MNVRILFLICMFSVCCFFSIEINAQDGITKSIKSATSDTSYKKFTYYRVGIDVSKIIRSQFAKNFKTYEFQFDANFTRETALALEFGTGSSNVDNQFLNYKSNNTFARIGIDKYFFGKEFKGDMDNAFVGVRYAFSRVSRKDAIVNVLDPLWGNTQTKVAGTQFMAHWIELTGGLRLELFKNVFAGWNIRAKTFLNPKKFELLPPAYLSGYGVGDKNTAFDYNFYVLYGIGKRK